MTGKLLATSDLHIAYPENRQRLDSLRPESDDDWLIVAGDVAELAADVEWAIAALAKRFVTVIWTPGNHELWTMPADPVQLRGPARYDYLVEMCRSYGVVTPEDPYQLWPGDSGPVRVAPLFLLYDYSFRPPDVPTKARGLEIAYEAGIVCSDEFMLHPDPFPSREAWCADRVARTEQRLAECAPDVPTVLVNHFPLIRESTLPLRYPIFAQWCGTDRTSDWHRRFHATAVVYGHLHIPRTSYHDQVRFEEVSIGYPREHRGRGLPRGVIRTILPMTDAP